MRASLNALLLLLLVLLLQLLLLLRRWCHASLDASDVAERGKLGILLADALDVLALWEQRETKSELADAFALLPIACKACGPHGLALANGDDETLLLDARLPHRIGNFWEFRPFAIVMELHIFCWVLDEPL